MLLLHLAFFAFALVSAITTVFAVQLQVRDALNRLGAVVGELRVVQSLRFDVQTLDVHFHEVVQQGRSADAQFDSDVESVALRLEHIGDSNPHERPAESESLSELANELRKSAARCLEAVRDGDAVAAQSVFKSQFEPLLRRISIQLQVIQQSNEEAQQNATALMVSYDAAMLVATLIIAAGGSVIVVYGMWIVRNRLLLPLRRLQQATYAFRSGDLSYRTPVASNDELGSLGVALNEMAEELEESHRAARRAEAMKAAVSFARGVAHDFKNLLQGASSALEELKSSLEPGNASRVDAAMLACEQAARLSRRLGRIASEDHGRPESIPLAETIRTISGSLDAALVKDVEIAVYIAGETHVFCDRDNLTQIVLNLLYNALEAMPDGGRIRFHEEITHQPTTPFGDHRNKPVKFFVEDTGPGIPADIQQRVFEPYVSTKAQQEGGRRGLGLAIVYAAVANSSGEIEIASSSPAGTTFAITLPRADG